MDRPGNRPNLAEPRDRPLERKRSCPSADPRSALRGGTNLTHAWRRGIASGRQERNFPMRKEALWLLALFLGAFICLLAVRARRGAACSPLRGCPRGHGG